MNKSITLIAASLLAGAAYAGEPAEDFSNMDADGNGELTRQEAQAHPDLQRYFGRADTDGDGSISDSEYELLMADLTRAYDEEPAE